MRYRNTTNYPVDLDTGQLLAPGQVGSADKSTRHDDLVETGALTEIPTPKPSPRPAKPAATKE